MRITKVFLKLFIFILASHTPLAKAQMLIPADSAHLQAQIRRDDEGFVSCGIRASVATVRDKEVEVNDFSINVDAQLFSGIIKSGKTLTPLSDISKNNYSLKTVMPQPIKFWIAKDSEGVPTQAANIRKSDTPGYMMGSSDLVKSFEIIYAIIHGEQMQFANRYGSESLDTVISFSAKLSEQELTSINACLGSLIDRMKKEIEKTEKPK